MGTTKIGIIREGKEPPDSRTPLVPEQARILSSKDPDIEIICESSSVRCYTDTEYLNSGIKVSKNISHCDIFLGVKEVPIHHLIPGKTYLFFSHTIKKQPQNRMMLKAILSRKIRLIDYECLIKDNRRVIAFGYWAGIVGTYNGLLGYGRKYKLYRLRRAYKCRGLEEILEETKKIKLPPVKIVITGKGRAGMGAAEMLDKSGIRRIEPELFLNRNFNEPVYTQIDVDDYHRRIDGKSFTIPEFFSHPDLFESDFTDYAKTADILISAIYWDPKAPILFSLDQMKKQDFRIKIIADITCDINGSIPSTKKASTIEDPFYDFDPFKNQVTKPFHKKNSITVMAIDNLPNELPRDASRDFGDQLVKNVFPELLTNNHSGMIKQATIAESGRLTPSYRYLSDYVNS